MEEPRNLFNLSGRTALVTAGTGHLGGAICEALCACGATVIVGGRDEGRRLAFAEALRGRFPGAETVPVRVRIEGREVLETDLEEVRQTCGPVDILVNSAYFGHTGSLAGMRPDAWDQTIRGGLSAVFDTTQVWYRRLRRERGVVLNIASIYGMEAPDFELYEGADESQRSSPAYGAAKAGVIQLTRYCAREFAGAGVRVNCISPGPFPKPEVAQALVSRLSGRVPLGRVGSPWELKGAVMFLCSDASTFVTGQNLCVDGGWTV